jgi:hypothetical protein
VRGVRDGDDVDDGPLAVLAGEKEAEYESIGHAVRVPVRADAHADDLARRRAQNPAALVVHRSKILQGISGLHRSTNPWKWRSPKGSPVTVQYFSSSPALVL